MAPTGRRHMGDPVGLVAARLDALGRREVMDQARQQTPAMRSVTAGTAVTAMGRNGLGVVHQPLDLVPRHAGSSRLLSGCTGGAPLGNGPWGTTSPTRPSLCSGSWGHRMRGALRHYA